MSRHQPVLVPDKFASFLLPQLLSSDFYTETLAFSLPLTGNIHTRCRPIGRRLDWRLIGGVDLTPYEALL